MKIELNETELEMIARALYTMADANVREARARRFMGEEYKAAREALRDDARKSARLATYLYSHKQP